MAVSLTVGAGAEASPPPAPPAYVMRAGEVLSAAARFDAARTAPLFADNVRASENGRPVADGKRAWLTWWGAHADRSGRVLGYSESSAGYAVGGGGGELLVMDQYDTVDRSHLPPHMLVDPRVSARAILYDFGTDGLIHAVRIERTGGFWQVPRAD